MGEYGGWSCTGYPPPLDLQSNYYLYDKLAFWKCFVRSHMVDAISHTFLFIQVPMMILIVMVPRILKKKEEEYIV